MEQDLTIWAQALSGRHVLLIGDLILDRYIYGDAERVSPEAPVPVLRTVDKRQAVGGSGNVAACLRALGCRVTCVGTVGDDPGGAELCRLLGDLDIDTSAIVKLPDRPTTTKTRLIGLAQHRHRQQLLRVDEEQTGALSAPYIERMTAAMQEAIPQVDAVCIEDYDKGVISPALVGSVVEAAGRHDCPVLVDPAAIADYRRYQGADILTPNRTELSIVAGRPCPTLADLASAAESLRDSLEARAVVVTVDREGALLVERGSEWKHLSTTPRSVYDNTGAGDAVLAMLAAAVAAKADLTSATRLANIAGGLEVEKFGCVPISIEEVLAELRLVNHRRDGKLRSVEELVAELNLRRDRGETIAFTNGCFDMLHAGHVDFLKRCRQQASLLIVGLNSDASVRAQNKGAGRPINTFADRATVIGALACADYVVGFEEPDPESLIRTLRPDVLVKGEDWADKGVVGREFVEAAGGKVVLLPLVEGRSTTKLIERIREGA